MKSQRAQLVIASKVYHFFACIIGPNRAEAEDEVFKPLMTDCPALGFDFTLATAGAGAVGASLPPELSLETALGAAFGAARAPKVAAAELVITVDAAKADWRSAGRPLAFGTSEGVSAGV